MIREAVTQQKHPGWTSLASVCKDWQLFIEKQNFHIWLDIELPKYSCRLCKRAVSISWSQHNSAIISNGIWKLFHTLSTWESGPEVARRDLMLELNAYSPSDSEHYCFPSDIKDIEGAAPNRGSWHDTRHGLVDGQQVTTPPCSAVVRLFGRID
ncbi:hypothetical protein B0T14DRAFT_579794 [Immersiella caudata]|uniref:Uncharacterized protein n=1 Tax=Immersiella caudata TaxID=314043 RepID=A0AA39X5D7_9PEZI|nr:hypothetical protein B0T14DRAFT_579794 [Immersiella caudata]